MKNLKKVLALVVAVAMLASMSFVASAATYTDVASNASYADAVNLLSNLGIIKGYEDGTFRPDNTVTRAEAATMIVRMLALDDEVENGDTNFTDVNADDWCSGFVNVAEANGIINGMGDGTFNPNGEVTYGQIVKMIVCALGYEPVALANGGYLGGGYLYAGSSQVTGFTKGVSGTANAAASRATVARLIYNALEVEIMDQETFSTGMNGSEYKVQENKTILSEYLELEKVDAVVVDTYLSSATYEEGDNEVTLVITKSYADEDSAEYEAGDEVSFVAEGTDAATLLGYTVTAYVGENEDGDEAIFAVAAKSGKNTVVTLDSELVKEFSETEIKYYKSENAKNTTTASINAFVSFKKADDVDTNNVVVNGFNAEGYVENYDVFTGVLDGSIEEVTLLDNNNDGDFEFIFATVTGKDSTEFVVATIDRDDDVWTFTNDDEDKDFDVDYEDDDMLYTIVKDGKIVDASAIAEGDVITVLDDSVSVITVYVSSTVVEGSVDEIDDDVYTINNKDYKLSEVSFEVTDTLDAGDEGLFYINAFGKVAYVDTTKSIANADFVYVIDADESEGDFGKNEYIVKVVNAKGAIEVLTIKSKKVDVYEEGGEVSEDLKDSEAFAFLEDYVGLIRIDTTAANEISVIYFPGSEDDFKAVERYADENTTEYNEARGTYGSVDIKPETLVFHYDSKEEDLEDAITVTTVGALFEDENSYKFIAYGEDGEVADVLVVTDAKTALDSEAPVMVVTKVSNVVVDDEDTVKITGVVDGATVSVIVDPDEAKDVADVVKGNVILYAESGSYVTDVAVLYTSDGETTGELQGTDDIKADEFSKEYVTIHEGEVTTKKAKYIVLDEDEENAKFYFADDVNVIVVDYTGNKMTVKAGSISDVKASSTKYDQNVFVKTSAEDTDVITDVVVFTTKAN